MDKVNIKDKFNDLNEWTPFELAGTKIMVRKKLSAKEVEDAGMEIAIYGMIVDEELGTINHAPNFGMVKNWVLCKRCTNIDMDAFADGDIVLGASEFADALPADVCWPWMYDDEYGVMDWLCKFRAIAQDRLEAQTNIGKRLLRTFGDLLGDGNFTEDAAKAQQLSEVLIDLIDKAKNYDKITASVKGKKSDAPSIPDGIAKKKIN